MSNYKIGQLVKVTNPGGVYSTFSTMFEKLGFRRKKRNDFVSSFRESAQIFAIDKHPDTGKELLALVDSMGNEVLISSSSVNPLVFREHKTIKTKYVVGDFVRVTNPGEVYAGYDRKFKELGFADTKRNANLGSMKKCAQIFGISTHDTHDQIILLALVDKDGNEILISEDGVELLKYPLNEIPTMSLNENFNVEVQSNGIRVMRNENDAASYIVTKEKFKELAERTKEIWG
jgi:hypothetical protein